MVISEIQEKLQEAKTKVAELKGKRNLLQEQFQEGKSRLETLKKFQDTAGKARILVQVVAQDTQNQIEYQISNLVSMALASVFSDPPEFKMKFIIRRNKTECDLMFSKKGNEIDIFSASGGGAVDTASFALRIAIWSLKRSRNVQILDEPFKFLSVDLQEKCSEMVKHISDKLNIQMILVSHLPNIIAAADNIIKVELVGEMSKVS